jgi:hypothetical protein
MIIITSSKGKLKAHLLQVLRELILLEDINTPTIDEWFVWRCARGQSGSRRISERVRGMVIVKGQPCPLAQPPQP